MDLDDGRYPNAAAIRPVATNNRSTGNHVNCQLFFIGPSPRKCSATIADGVAPTAALARCVYRESSHVRHHRLQEVICVRPELDNRCCPQRGGTMIAYA